MRFDRSWLPGIIAIVVLVLLFRQLSGLTLAWPVRLALATAGGLWFVWTAWKLWRNPTGRAEFSSGGKRVQYWRGQRIEIAPAPRQRHRQTPPPLQLFMVIVYGLSGAGMLVLVLNELIRRLG